jgi:hypothetical protein
MATRGTEEFVEVPASELQRIERTVAEVERQLSTFPLPDNRIELSMRLLEGIRRTLTSVQSFPPKKH